MSAVYVLVGLIAYLIGSVNFAIIFSKKFAGFDVREKGSKNAGTTNVLRTVGKKAAILTLICDILKGVVAVLIAILATKIWNHADVEILKYLAGFMAIVGHTFPVFYGFKGGKGVATSLGSMIAINPVLALSCFGIFLVIVAITKYVSLGAIVGISMSPIMMIFTKNSKGLIATLFLTVSVIYTHRENIKRLLSGTERKLGEKK